MGLYFVVIKIVMLLKDYTISMEGKLSKLSAPSFKAGEFFDKNAIDLVR